MNNVTVNRIEGELQRLSQESYFLQPNAIGHQLKTKRGNSMTPIKSIGIVIDKYCGFSTVLNHISDSHQDLSNLREFLR